MHTKTRDEWKNVLEATLPQPEKYIARNRAITAHYAQWYLQRPHLFKWAGMAAFASSQVGIGLAVAEMLAAPDALVALSRLPDEAMFFAPVLKMHTTMFNFMFALPVALHDTTTRQLIRNDLDLIKQGNDAIFADIAWAHLAYMNEGLQAIEANVSQPNDELLLRGFQLIDQGAQMYDQAGNHDDARALIQQGNITLLKHEQTTTLPPFFDRMTGHGSTIASFGSLLDVEGAFIGGIFPIGKIASFSGHAGYLTTLAGLRSVSNVEDRWMWIEQDVLPAWERADATYTETSVLHHRLSTLAQQQPTLLQEVATLMQIVYPMVGLKFDCVGRAIA